MRKITDITGRLGNQMFQFAYIYCQQLDGKLLDVYLQDEFYFNKHKEKIKKLYGDGITHLPYVAIHVRRGDYVESGFYVNLFEEGYYQQAMKEFPGAQFMVFSDDIEWCKQQSLFKDCLFSEGFNEIEDLNRMASCEGHIIANSSYSWWGAYLSPHGGKVVCPGRWFSDGWERTKTLDDWVKVYDESNKSWIKI